MTKQQKAEKIIAERRLTVEVVGDGTRPGLILASVRGESAEIYKLGYKPGMNAHWGCTCEASSKFGRLCSHLIALQMVTVKP